MAASRTNAPFYVVAALVLVAACETSTGGGGLVADTTGGDSAAGDGAASDSAASDSAASDSAASDTTTPDDGQTADVVAANCGDDQLSDLFHSKIKPLVSAGQPTTCNQCHFSGVDLGMFVQDTPCQSMACMVDKGLVDFANPANSEVLSFINKAKPESTFIDAAVQKAEYDAFLGWITYSAGCHATTCGKIDNPCGTASTVVAPVKPMLGGCDEKSLGDAFAVKVYAYRERCAHCHATNGKDNAKSGAPGFIHADAGAAGALFTMYNILGKGYVDLDNPTKSLLLTKPLAPKAGGVDHGGGVKFANTKDVSYKAFLVWIEQLKACKGDGK